ncbi:MAG: hypothetical protein GQF41_0435 [Candidatus Rifleibacterium amylolyticum]|nr:MAG: hypothetical protein GQF41_0435 [Candidatus Rifleibacterium amylolyticum]
MPSFAATLARRKNIVKSYSFASKLPDSAELLYPAQLSISTSLCKKFSLMRNPPAPFIQAKTVSQFL